MTDRDQQIADAVRRYWGFSTLRPLQEEAIQAALEHRDSLVVLPTGGGKSLCYQVPPLVAGRTDVVVSPLIALMKDQVDGLRASGYPAAALHSGMTLDELRATERGIADGQFRLLFVAPERLLTPRFLALIARLHVRAFAIDEAHCISQWGHDFRPEYRQLAELKTRFPEASVHAYTATATRARPRRHRRAAAPQRPARAGRHVRPAQPHLPRRAADRVAHAGARASCGGTPARRPSSTASAARTPSPWPPPLQASGVRAGAYHAGMEADERRRTQEAFADEALDVVVRHGGVRHGHRPQRRALRRPRGACRSRSSTTSRRPAAPAATACDAECVLLYSGGRRDALGVA